MLKIYGYSDDLVEIEEIPEPGKTREIDCYERDVRIAFTDGTAIRIGYGGKTGHEGEWWIDVLKTGSASQRLRTTEQRRTEDGANDAYSDMFLIDADVKSTRLLKQKKFSC